MKRLRPALIRFVSLAVVLLTAAGLVRRGKWGLEDRVGFRAFGCLYTLKCSRYGIILRGPPHVPADELAQARHAVWDLTNLDVRCGLFLTPRGDGDFDPTLAVVSLVRDPEWPSRLRRRFESLGTPALWQALVPALEDPDRFAAAHVLLGRGARTNEVAPARKEAGFVKATFNGLDVSLRPEIQYEVLESFGRERRILKQSIDCQGENVVFVDPGQRGRILSRWQDQLDIDIAILPYWIIVSVLLAPPGLWVFALVRMRWRRARGLCPICGYDLRASQGRCPECGTENLGGKTVSA